MPRTRDEQIDENLQKGSDRSPQVDEERPDPERRDDTPPARTDAIPLPAPGHQPDPDTDGDPVRDPMDPAGVPHERIDERRDGPPAA